MYKKRTGTSGIRGQLYETKISSLLLLRAQHNVIIDDFYLGTNVEGNGAFDDICLRATIKGSCRPLAIFIQAKHTESDIKCLTVNNRNDLAKYFESFMKIQQRFNIKSSDEFFKINYKDIDCVFIIYTTKQGEPTNEIYNGDNADILNDLLATRDLGSQPLYTKEDVNFLCKIALKEEIKKLATRFVTYIYNKTNDMNDELILRYHVVLAKKVINVSDIQPNGRRIAKFRIEFFSSKDDELLLIKDKIFEEVLDNHANTRKDKIPDDKEIRDLLDSFLSEPSEYTLSQLICKNVLIYKKGQLKIFKDLPLNIMKQLDKINMPVSEIDIAITRSVKQILRHFEFDVPAAFGNKDLTIKGNEKKIESRLNYLTDQICKLLEKPVPKNVIVIEETDLSARLFRVNGGLDSAVGNALVLDEKTNLLKFNDNLPKLEKYSKALLEKLEQKISNFQKYRFDVRVKNFPKLLFELHNVDLARFFFNKLVFYTNQEDEGGVGQILKQEIEALEGTATRYFRVKSEAIFNTFHAEIQNWWLIKKEAKYLRKDCDFYQKAKSNIINNQMISVASMLYLSAIRNLQCTFKDNPTTSLDFVDLLFKNVIVTDITRLTFIKLTRTLNDNDYVVLDLEYLQYLPISDLKALITEINIMNEEKIIIIICDNSWHKNILPIVRSVQKKNVTIITDKTCIDMIMKHFPEAKIINDTGNSLFDLNKTSQQNIVNRARTIFQGQEMTLDLLVDDASVALIKGSVLNKILHNETIIISDPLELPARPIDLMNYDLKGLKYEINDLYIDRRLSRGQLTDEKEREASVIQTLHDLNDDIVLITAKPGMGKSTLLSFLSIKTKQLDKHLWIIRINLLDHSRQFNMWKKNKTNISTLEMLTFICQILAKNKLGANKSVTLSMTDSIADVHVADSMDNEWIKFELELFLHYFKNKKIIFLFDGFDEICPDYENEVVSFINVIRNCPQNHKIWITSRPYKKIKYILQTSFNILEPYELVPFADNEQEIYFEKFWKYNLVLNELNDAQLQNIKDFLQFITKSRNKFYVSNFIRINKPQNFLLNKVYFHFMVYLQKEVQFLPKAFPLGDKYRSVLIFSASVGKYTQRQFITNVGDKGIKEMLEFVGTPLHMYLVADYFLSAIIDDSGNTKEWDLDVNTYAIYENFLESKLKKIRFEDKNKMDIYNPDIIETYETVRKDFINMHKKLAAYALFHNVGQKVFNKEELKEITAMIEKIEKGGEKTGLIYNTSNKVPLFIHMTFTEYFAVEYIADTLKYEKNIKKQEKICSFIIDAMFFESPVNVLNIMDLKVKMDKEFTAALEKNKKYIFDVLISQSINVEKDRVHETTGDKVKSALNEAITKNLSNFLSIFMDIFKENVNKHNLDDFINCLATSGFLKTAAANNYRDVIGITFNLIRDNDISKWRRFIGNPQYYCDNIITNFRIQRFLRHHFKRFYEWSQLCDHGSFVMNSEAA